MSGARHRGGTPKRRPLGRKDAEPIWLVRWIKPGWYRPLWDARYAACSTDARLFKANVWAEVQKTGPPTTPPKSQRKSKHL